MKINVPVANDGTAFGPHLRRAGGFRVGAKGSERKITDFNDALNYLKTLPSAHWRRPNSNGNWGLVTAVDWSDMVYS